MILLNSEITLAIPLGTIVPDPTGKSSKFFAGLRPIKQEETFQPLQRASSSSDGEGWGSSVNLESHSEDF